jgi:hypothetical protein
MTIGLAKQSVGKTFHTFDLWDFAGAGSDYEQMEEKDQSGSKLAHLILNNLTTIEIQGVDGNNVTYATDAYEGTTEDAELYHDEDELYTKHGSTYFMFGPNVSFFFSQILKVVFQIR